MYKFLVVFVLLCATQANAAESHLFILAGQSNMGPKEAASGFTDAHVPGGEAYIKGYSSDNWEAIRKIQVETADARDYARWVDWDDLNGPLNTVHLAAADGSSTRQDSSRYPELARRWAKAAADLIQGIEPVEDEDAPTVDCEQ